MDFLNYLEPEPVSVPSYSAFSTTVRYPVYEQKETYELPDYTPAVYSTTLILRKLEWLSPYEPSPYRSWKPLVMELNSTQLNFYSVDDLPLIGKSANISKIKSRKQLEQLVLFNKAEQELVLEAVKRYPQRYLSPKNLVRSYTLQHASIGIPVDYKKRNYCLRLRLEAEQFLVQFPNIEAMISWANMISTGTNVSLDIDSRAMPTDRSVPRRRRGHRRDANNRRAQRDGGNRLRSYSDSEVIRRELSPPLGHNVASSNKGFMGRIFGRRSNSVTTLESALDLLQLQSSQSNEEEEEEDTSDNENENDNENEEEEEEEVDSDEDSIIDLYTDFNSFTSEESSYTKWAPDPKEVSQRKLLKDAIRCMKLLPDDETWIGKPIMTPSRPPKFSTCNDLRSKDLESALKSKNKFIKEFIVGTQGLIAV